MSLNTNSNIPTILKVVFAGLITVAWLIGLAVWIANPSPEPCQCDCTEEKLDQIMIMLSDLDQDIHHLEEHDD